MKQIIEFLKEGLKINKNIKIDNKEHKDYSNIEVPGNLYLYLHFKDSKDRLKHYNKMQGYYKKGSKPSRLVNSIKEKEKLLKRWYFTIILGWEDAFIEFKDAIIDRGYATEDQLRAFIQKYMIDKEKDQEVKNEYEKYLTL